jgi:hypothetical protein
MLHGKRGALLAQAVFLRLILIAEVQPRRVQASGESLSQWRRNQHSPNYKSFFASFCSQKEAFSSFT